MKILSDIKTIAILSLVVALTACQNEQKEASINTEESAPTEVIIINNDDELIALADSLNLEEEKYADLLEAKTKEDKKVSLYYRKIHLQQSELDSLNSIINGLTVVNQVLNEKYEKPALSYGEKAIQKIVFDMHLAWKNLPKTKDANDILQYFQPKYVVNRVAIETDNSTNIKNYTQADFEKFIKNEVIKKEGLSFEFGNVEFLDIQIKGNKFFNVAYKCILRTYINDKLQDTNSLLVTATGENNDGKWGLASYSWVSFKYKK